MNWMRQSWDRKQADAFALGVEVRERAVAAYMAQNQLTERPMLKDIIEDIITEVHGARLLRGVLALDTFAQTERVGERLEVTLNTRIAEMQRVKDPKLIEHVALWHEDIHIEVDFVEAPRLDGEAVQLSLPEMVPAPPQLIMCRRGPAGFGPEAIREFRAENAALAASIAGPDLARCDAFLPFQALAEQGGELGSRGWRLLYHISETIGVNISALVRFLTYRGLVRVDRDGEHQRLYGSQRLIGRGNGGEWNAS
jgi:hypothetical protein